MFSTLQTKPALASCFGSILDALCLGQQLNHVIGEGHTPNSRGLHTMGSQTLHVLDDFMVHNLVFMWPTPLFFMVLEAHGTHNLCLLFLYGFDLMGFITCFFTIWGNILKGTFSNHQKKQIYDEDPVKGGP